MYIDIKDIKDASLALKKAITEYSDLADIFADHLMLYPSPLLFVCPKCNADIDKPCTYMIFFDLFDIHGARHDLNKENVIEYLKTDDEYEHRLDGLRNRVIMFQGQLKILKEEHKGVNK